MILTFIGAAHEVTGSCHLVTACGKNLLIDCGMEQGADVFVNQEIPVAAGEIDFVLLTHAHIDHSGLIPMLCAQGFSGRIITTLATADLCSIMLRDSAHIQESEAEWRNRKAKRSGAPEYVPLYTMADAEAALKLIEKYNYDEIIQLCEGIKIRLRDVGHLLGSAAIELWLEEDGQSRKLCFSGDIGNVNRPLVRDPQNVDTADYVIMESTYGDRIHSEERPDYVGELSRIIQQTLDRGGNLVIPSFAVGRTQEILYFIRQIKAAGLIKGHDGFPVYVDSPLAVEATSIFNRNQSTGFYDCEAMELVTQGINPISFDGLKFSITSDESKAINIDEEPKVIISASGMCEAGRIRHHLKHNLWRSESTILFVGYQSHGTMGRKLLDGAKSVKLFSEPIEVRAHIEQLGGISGHADKNGLIDWVGAMSPKPKCVFVVHGEADVCDSFTECLTNEHGYTAHAPYSGASYDLAAGKFIEQPAGIPIVKKSSKPAAKKASAVFERLVEAGRRLTALIKRFEGRANKDLASFATQINALCDKWEDDN